MITAQLIAQHQQAVERFRNAEPYTEELRLADEALVASFARLQARSGFDDDEESVFHRPQAG